VVLMLKPQLAFEIGLTTRFVQNRTVTGFVGDVGPWVGCCGRFCTGNLRECVPQDRSYDGWLISYLNDFTCFLS
jgi:hypothetical protein